MKGVKAALKNGSPTLRSRPSSISSHQRPDRPDEDHKGRDRQQDVVGHQRAFAADQRAEDPRASIAPARSANSVSAPPMNRPGSSG
jgi:hypothetical protein